MIETDFLVVGSGIAGLWFAHRVSSAGCVLIVTKKSDTDSNTNYAQGGIAAAFGADDSPDLHYADTLKAGEGLCHEEVVRAVSTEGPGLVGQLYELGVKFDTYHDSHGDRHFQLGREGGHLRHRIVHARDFTGQEVEHGLVRAVRSRPNVTMFEDNFCAELILGEDRRCVGCRVIDEASGALREVHAGCTLLASGGIGQVYASTTNPPIATGDGIAMAFRAGARVSNMEFIQFHPTALYGHRIDGRTFLISEAVRGEGGLLKTQDGATFMERYHELGNLAPRDVVARAIDAEMKKRGDDHVVLDVTHLDPERVKERFPNIYQQCLKFGIDITEQPIPVVPAAHYVCGGIEVNLDGQSSIPGLFAAGECACSGLHGANRLASNSLLEALVLAEHAANAAIGNRGPGTRDQGSEPRPPNPDTRPASACPPPATPHSPSSAPACVPPPQIPIVEPTDHLRTLMARDAGIVRSDAGLTEARDQIEELSRRVEETCATQPRDIKTLELRNMVTVARLIVRSAVRRKESRGLHFNRDYPGRDDVHYRHDTVLSIQEEMTKHQ